MASALLNATTPVDVLAATGKAGNDCRLDNQSHYDLKIWLGTEGHVTAPAPSSPCEKVIKPWHHYDVTGEAIVWAWNGQATRVGVGGVA